jgi:FtsZ-interacting cell division protein ZipA
MKDVVSILASLSIMSIVGYIAKVFWDNKRQKRKIVKLEQDSAREKIRRDNAGHSLHDLIERFNVLTKDSSKRDDDLS